MKRGGEAISGRPLPGGIRGLGRAMRGRTNGGAAARGSANPEWPWSRMGRRSAVVNPLAASTGLVSSRTLRLEATWNRSVYEGAVMGAWPSQMFFLDVYLT